MRLQLTLALLAFSVLVVADFAAWAQDARGPGVVEYTVGEGDTCASIAEQLYGSGRYANVIHDYNPHAGRDQARCDQSLRPGTTLRLPRHAPTTTSADAEVTAVLREVRSRPPDRTNWGDAHRGQDLFRGWRVNTLDQSGADVTFRDETLLRLRENTLVIIFGPTSQRVRKSGSKAVLERGSLGSRLSELAGGFRVETPSAKVAFGAGLGLVTVDDQSASRVANHQGREATVTSSKGTGSVRLRAGMGTKVRRGENPRPPRPLPPAPTWTEGQPETFLRVAGVGGTLEGSWNPVEGASFYRVEIAAEPDGRRPVGATGVPATVNRFELRGLQAGTYYIAVAAIDDDRFEGPPSAWRPVHLVEAEVTSPLAADSEAEGDGSAPRGLRVLAGCRLLAPEGHLCALEEGPPEQQLTFTGEGSFSLRCVDAEGLSSAALPVEVSPLSVSPHLAEGATGFELLRGREQTIELALSSPLGLPQGISASGGAGLEVTSVEPGEAGTLRLVIRVAEAAPEVTEIRLTARVGEDDLELGRVVASTRAAQVAPAPRAGEPEAPPRRSERALPAQELLATLVSPWAFGVRDEQRPGSGLWATFGYLGQLDDRREGQLALSLGTDVGLFDDRLRLDLGFAVNFDGTDLGTRAGVGWRALGGDTLGLMIHLGAWIPFEAAPGQRYRARLMPSVDLSVRLLRRVVLRTRQGLFLDTHSEGGFLWSSAYAVDLHIYGPLTIGLEGLLLLGVEHNDPVVAPAASLALWLELGVVEIALGGQYAFTAAAADRLGRLTAMASLRVRP